jgi:hypothetical protein
LVKEAPMLHAAAEPWSTSLPLITSKCLRGGEQSAVAVRAKPATACMNLRI